MKRKVIYLSHARLSPKVRRDWYIDALLERGVTVEYWDLMPLLFGDIDEHGSTTADFLRTPRDYQQIEALLKADENRSADYIMLVTYEGRTARLFRLLSRHNCRMLFMAWGAFPEARSRRWQVLRGMASAPVRSFKEIAYWLYAEANRRLKRVNKFDVVFAAGRVMAASDLYSRKIVPVNLADYDQYRQMEREGERLVAKRYAVFLDVYLPFQSDIIIEGLDPLDAPRYFSSLNRFFAMLEEQYGVTVVIAAHPKAEYQRSTFEGREVFNGRTAELVKHAEFVLAHHSTSIGYAVLNLKPVIFIYTEEMRALYEDTRVSTIRSLARYLDASAYNIDRISKDDRIAVSEVDAERYNAFKYDFLTTPESEHISTAEIFCRELAAE